MSALRLENAQRHERERTITYSWRTGEIDADGWALGVEVVVSHNKAARAITITAFRVGYQDGMVRNQIDLMTSHHLLRLASFPCERYSAAALRRADFYVRGHLSTVSQWIAGAEPSGWEVVGRYGRGWKVVTTEMTRAEALERLREYRVNDPGTEYRVRREVAA